MKYTMMFKLISQRQATVVEPATAPSIDALSSAWSEFTYTSDITTLKTNFKLIQRAFTSDSDVHKTFFSELQVSSLFGPTMGQLDHQEYGLKYYTKLGKDTRVKVEMIKFLTYKLACLRQIQMIQQQIHQAEPSPSVHKVTEPGKICTVSDIKDIPEYMDKHATAHGSPAIRAIISSGILRGTCSRRTGFSELVFFYRCHDPNDKAMSQILFDRMKGFATSRNAKKQRQEQHQDDILGILVFNKNVYDKISNSFGYYSQAHKDDLRGRKINSNESTYTGKLSLKYNLAAVVLFDLTDQVFREEAKKIQDKFPTVSCYHLKEAD